MEDILASIRRIIADDQMHANRPAPVVPRRATAERTGSEATSSERAVDYAEVLDLARTPNAADATVQTRAEPMPAARVVNGSAHDDAPLFEDREQRPQPGPSKPIGFTPQASQGHGSGYAAPALVRDYAQSGPGVEPEPAHVPDESDDDPLVSPALGTTVMSAFETLAATVVLQNTDMLDRVMRELMRPLIKSWLDENLPTLVERLVRTEIERVARGGRS